MSEYGEVKDLLDKILKFGTLKCMATSEEYAYGEADYQITNESTELLGEIEKDLDRLVVMSCRGDHVGTGYRMLDEYRKVLDTVDEGLQKELLELLESIEPVWIHEGTHMWLQTRDGRPPPPPLRVEHNGLITFPLRSEEATDG